MPRPKTKTELLNLSQQNFKKLFDFIDAFDAAEQNSEFPEGTMNRNIRDVLAHLHHWHLMMLEWYEVGMAGNKPEMPAKGYTWKTLPALNLVIWEKYNQTTLEEAKNLVQKSHGQLLKVIESHSNEELFEKMRYKWTGSTSLGAYLISCTSSHYDWALKLIKKQTK
tara:strand:+ start:47 stop:544 length:498 start_codon:yes stop_codon:yes gene_type:complete